MKNNEYISKIRHLRNIADQFIDFKGQQSVIPASNIEAIVAAMGYAVNDMDQLAAQAYELDVAQWHVPLKPVTVLSPYRERWGVDFYIHQEMREQKASWKIHLENGELISGSALLLDLEVTGDYWMESGQYLRLFLPLPTSLPQGYHTFSIQRDHRSARSSLIVTPDQCFNCPSLAAERKLWGSAIQLYTVRSERNWGMGDFTDLKEIIKFLASHGADFVGLNPIHSLFPNRPKDCSPYSPSDRNFINPLYIDIESTPEYSENEFIQEYVNSQPFQHRLNDLRASDLVDYEKVSAVKYDCFMRLFEHFQSTHLGKHTAREQAFLQFQKKQGDALLKHAQFEMLLHYFSKRESNAWGWPAWNASYHDCQSIDVHQFSRDHPGLMDYFIYLQFLAFEQLDQVQRTAKAASMEIGLYRDLAVGADRGGAEVWSNRDVFCESASIGAPPDDLGPNGQNWGLPPMDPIKLKAKAYQPFITLLRNNMQSCGALRIDHALGLLRLWWCPPNKGAESGAYVYNDFFDLLGILALESQRNQCMVIAEDLGTIPNEVKEYFPKLNLFSNKVFYFEISAEGCLSPEHYPAKSLAVVGNHDVPTLAAYWNGQDLELRKSLALYGSRLQDYQNDIDHREWSKSEIITALDRYFDCEKAVRSHEEMTLEGVEAVHAYLFSSKAQLTSIQLEDLMLMVEPVNIPGTCDEYANWQRKLSWTLEELCNRDDIKRLCRELNKIRQAS